MTSPEQNTETKRAAPAPLWRAMRAFLCLLFDLFGDPGELAARGWLDRKNRALIMPWLRAGEAFLRRLLFIEALALGLQPRPPQKRAARLRVRRRCEFHPDKPDDWRVSFRLFPAARPARRRDGRAVRRPPLGLPPALATPPPQPAPFHRAHAPALQAASRTPRAPRESGDAWPIAERFEALLRAYNAPHACARRLVRMLHRDAPRALSALRPAPAQLANLFGVPTFTRCNAIVASRRRKWERAHARPGG